MISKLIGEIQMIFIRKQMLTPHEARQLEHDGFEPRLHHICEFDKDMYEIWISEEKFIKREVKNEDSKSDSD